MHWSSLYRCFERFFSCVYGYRCDSTEFSYLEKFRTNYSLLKFHNVTAGEINYCTTRLWVILWSNLVTQWISTKVTKITKTLASLQSVGLHVNVSEFHHDIYDNEHKESNFLSKFGHFLRCISSQNLKMVLKLLLHPVSSHLKRSHRRIKYSALAAIMISLLLISIVSDNG